MDKNKQNIPEDPVRGIEQKSYVRMSVIHGGSGPAAILMICNTRNIDPRSGELDAGALKPVLLREAGHYSGVLLKPNLSYKVLR